VRNDASPGISSSPFDCPQAAVEEATLQGFEVIDGFSRRVVRNSISRLTLNSPANPIDVKTGEA
jgi:hypothetical protein